MLGIPLRFICAVACAVADPPETLYVFSGGKCPPCARLDYELLSDEVTADLQERKIALALVREWNGSELAERHHIAYYPTLLLINGEGQEVARSSGFAQGDELLTLLRGEQPEPLRSSVLGCVAAMRKRDCGRTVEFLEVVARVASMYDPERASVWIGLLAREIRLWRSEVRCSEALTDAVTAKWSGACNDEFRLVLLGALGRIDAEEYRAALDVLECRLVGRVEALHIESLAALDVGEAICDTQTRDLIDAARAVYGMSLESAEEACSVESLSFGEWLSRTRRESPGLLPASFDFPHVRAVERVSAIFEYSLSCDDDESARGIAKFVLSELPGEHTRNVLLASLYRRGKPASLLVDRTND